MKTMVGKSKKTVTFPKFDSPRPDFGNPPVTEVLLALQFETLPSFNVPQVGLLWQLFKSRYPVSSVKNQLTQEIEKFGHRQPGASLRLQLVEAPVVPRCWFENEAGTELVQVQPDRFIFNWKSGNVDQPYPRYEKVRAKFKRHLKTFENFLRDNDLGRVVPNQCEVTYVNEVHSGIGWERPGQFNRIFSMWSGRFSDRFFSEPEEINLRFSQVMRSQEGDPIGRLRVSVEPRYRISDDRPMLNVTLTARGAPIKKTRTAVIDFLDLGREYVVRGFASVTSKRMHEIWERTDG